MTEVKHHVTFSPPLHDQRQIWILDIIRRERSLATILDVGCGSGGLLNALAQPAPFVADPNDTTDDSIRTTEIQGLDIDVKELQRAVISVEPPEDNPDAPTWMKPLPRWEDLQATIWKGGLETFNKAFVNVDCIVATEVIEHLTEDVKNYFAPMLLGVYHPRILLMTTPNYAFNYLFSPPDRVLGDHGYPDPTHRTTRHFRHHDHKFEWTPEEFIEYCSIEADLWGYDVSEMSTIGYPRLPDPWNRRATGPMRGATFVVVFRRKEEYQQQREVISKSWLLEHQKEDRHEVLQKFHHKVHPAATRTSLAEPLEIAQAVFEFVCEYEESEKELEGLWFQHVDVAIECGGQLQRLIHALEGDLRFEVMKSVGLRRGLWRVKLVSGLPDKPLVCQDEGIEEDEDENEDETSRNGDEDEEGEAEDRINEAVLLERSWDGDEHPPSKERNGWFQARHNDSNEVDPGWSNWKDTDSGPWGAE